jgi:hypothetical protein
MVHQIIKSKYRIFTETLILTVLILIIGFAIGFFVESYRINDTYDYYKEFEIKALDLRLQTYYFETLDKSNCNKAIQENFIFADNLYNEGLLLERYEQVNQIKSDVLTEKKIYVLLKTQLWLNSIKLNEQCNSSIHTLVYVYLQNPDLIKEAEQAAMSKTLTEVKDELNNTIILIPIAGDLQLEAVDMQLRTYNVTSIPSIIIDEKTVLYGFHNKTEIFSLLK